MPATRPSRDPSDKTRCERAWATGNTWERETKKDLQRMSEALQSDAKTLLATCNERDKAFVESLRHDDPLSGDHILRYLSCMFPANPLGPKDRPKHVPKIPTAEKMQAGLFALIVGALDEKKC